MPGLRDRRATRASRAPPHTGPVNFVSVSRGVTTGDRRPPAGSLESARARLAPHPTSCRAPSSRAHSPSPPGARALRRADDPLVDYLFTWNRKRIEGDAGAFGPCIWPTPPAPGASAWREWGRALVFLAAIALLWALALVAE